MNIIRINEFQAKHGQSDTLRDSLRSIISLIESFDGCQSCQLLQSLDDPCRILIIEVWESIEAHKTSVKNIPPSDFEKVMRILDRPPKGEYYSA
jgi:quinol monooxygenase YgiN